MKKFNNQSYGSYVDRMNYGGAKFCRFALFPLMLLMLLLLPTRMVAETTTEDPRCALFKGLEGISDVTITDNGSYPWKMLDLKADGMENLGFTIPDGSKGLMSSNYLEDGSSSETVVNFTVEKPMLLTFKYLVSSEYNFDKATITLDNKEPWTISAIMQIEIKALLSVGEHSLKLSYTKDGSGNENADRTCIYDLKTATTFSEYVADYVATNSTLTFKKITSDNLEGLDLSRMAVVDNIDGVQDVCTNYSSIKNIVFDESFKTYAPTSLREFFKGCETLETISGLEYLNTAKVTDMGNMFHGCSALTSLDLTNFNTANVEFMDHMFEGCSALKSLDLTNFNTAKVTNMSFMFYGCSALTSLDLTNFNTANVTDMSYMFMGSSALTSLDLTNFNTAKVEFMDNMFNGCSALTSLDLTNFNTAKVVNMNNMFEGCSALTTIYASDKFVTDNVSNGSDMFTGCKSLKDYSDSKTGHTFAYCGTNGYFTPGGCGYAEYDLSSKTLTFRYKGVKPEGAYALNEGASEPGWLTYKNEIKEVVFNASFANARPTSCYYWFSSCKNLADIEGIENLNTENVTNMNSMFDRCSALTSLDLTNFNTAKVSDMSYMFMGCTALTTIFVSNKFVTDLVTSSDNMFHMCINLIGAIEYDGSKSDHTYANYDNGYFSPEGGFHAYAEFNNATGTLTFSRGLSKPAGAYDLNVGNNTPEWSTQKEDINKVVFDASFANARPTSCYKWFDMCTSLTEIEGIENLNTEKVTNMGSMFSGCHVLNPLDVSNFDTQNVEDMSCMFSNCEGLNSLDLSKFDTQKVTNMNSMFWNSSALTTIYVSDKFVTTKVSSGSEMFKDCTSLKGAIDKYEDSKTDHTYANYKTGYFTKLVGKNGEEMIGAAGETLAAENLILEDGKDFVAYEPFAAKDASYCRDIPKGSTWGTLCLPFEVSLANQNFRAFKLLSADDATETVELEEIETSIAAGTPVIIKMKDGANSLSISEADKAIAKDVQASETANGNYQLQGIYTQKVFDKDADNNCYIVKGNKLMNPAKLLENSSTTQVGSKPFRAYMVGNTTASAAGARMFSIAIGGGTTAIDSLNTIADDKAVYYDLQGNRLNAPQKGINIVKRGGKTMKVIIK